MLFASTGRLQYSISDIPNFLRARMLAAKADAALDQEKFHEVITKHACEGYDSFKYFDKQHWLRSKMMRSAGGLVRNTHGSRVGSLGLSLRYILARFT